MIDTRLEEVLLALLAKRRRGASICPSEAALAVGGEGRWRALMEPVRRASRRLANCGRVDILQRGKVVDASDFKGPIQVRTRP